MNNEDLQRWIWYSISTSDFYFHVATAVSITGRRSKVSLYNKTLVSMDEQGGFSPEDAGGFIRTQAMRLKEYHRFKKAQENNE